MKELLEKLPKSPYDKYDYRARILPGLYTLLPIFISVWVCLQEISSWDKIITGLASCGIISVIARTTRNQGRKKQTKMFKHENGKLPTTTMLRHRDNTLDPFTKERYHDCLRKNKLNISTETEERLDSTKADYQYDSAINWLKEQTRDDKKFPLVKEELINYGHDRNLWAMKYYGIFMNLIMIVINGAVIYYRWGFNINEIPAYFGLSIGLCLLSLFWWVCLITKSKVILSAEAYAKTLLASCEKL